MVVMKPLLTPSDVERMIRAGELDPDATFELVGGEIVYLSPPELYHSQVCVAIILALAPFARRIGALLFEGAAGFVVGTRYEQIRSPDVSLVTAGRSHILEPQGSGGRLIATAAPDLAVEVLSREQHGEAYARPKVAEYLAAGAKVVWLADPDTRTVRVYEPNQSEYAVYSADTEINLDAIAEGFSAPVASFFP